MQLTGNLLLWKWSGDYDTPAKRKSLKLKFSDVTSAFAATGAHPAIGEVDLSEFEAAVANAFVNELKSGLFKRAPLKLTLHRNCAVLGYSGDVRFSLMPKVAELGKCFGLNASEF